ncbi:hypothetical protein [Glycomyces sp. NRRL B-16210]|uniref:hypothetical protein n=1 Tax=Glycomyces sp. NRRL B-16210 TaxID=1463821 RepID=UPI0004C1C902|nr:hypothetical protein [Glycomyces sp. NRRL B-16210]
MDDTPETETVAEEEQRHRIRHLLRWIASMLACVLAVLAITAAIAAFYARLELLDTDRFTDRTAVIAEDERVRAAIADLVTETIVDAVDLERIAGEAIDSAGGNRPAAVDDLIASAAEAMRERIAQEVSEFVASQAYLDLWDAAVREAHASLVSALRGENAGAVLAEGDTLALDLGRVVAVVKERLVEADFAAAAHIPQVEAQYVLVESEQVPELQSYVERLEWAAIWLPWIGLALLAAAFVLAPRKWIAALVVGGLSAILALGALLGLAEGRAQFVERAEDADFAPLTYDAFTSGLRWAYIEMLAAGAVLVVVAALVMRRRHRRGEDAAA